MDGAIMMGYSAFGIAGGGDGGLSIVMVGDVNGGNEVNGGDGMFATGGLESRNDAAAETLFMCVTEKMAHSMH